MLTLFATAKTFRTHSADIQYNALQSRKALHPNLEMILFGDYEGSVEMVREFEAGSRPSPESALEGE